MTRVSDLPAWLLDDIGINRSLVDIPLRRRR
jgi:hypothetical protein